ncbi:putative alkanesulfonate ABC transporter membrane protein [Megalodesulfovibrio gigas DSM 1382 = ATCC 19364]|uniref:Putative alkanesulfonate ABC transporter membrane protein n=1 Tax=Megalodesulfovibrio gigas (strain ATCC 19364 / DSM 1382 / NCIMB 9332 / VKM B-1759) TaxID=1121448 RepID=T2G8D1_MEGG1|nr:putative alkanesulfonate ABC transporter membrane protein [Megalodesulfovibrio gigas DSM 1382 = ATCC 19364]
MLLGRGLRVLRAGSYGPAGTNPALRLGTINPWPATLPTPMQRTVSTTRMDTRLRRETQSGRIEVRRFGSGAPAQADVTFRCLGNQATALLTFHRDACRNGARWFTAPWLPLLGFPAHAARFFTPPQRAGRGDLYSDYTTTLLVRGIEEVL